MDNMDLNNGRINSVTSAIGRIAASMERVRAFLTIAGYAPMLVRLLSVLGGKHTSTRKALEEEEPISSVILRLPEDTGCSARDLHSLRWKDVNLDMSPPRAVLREHGRGGSETRIVYFTSNAAAYLRACREAQGGNDGTPVFARPEPGT